VKGEGGGGGRGGRSLRVYGVLVQDGFGIFYYGESSLFERLLRVRICDYCPGSRFGAPTFQRSLHICR